MKGKKKKLTQENETPKRISARKRTTINYNESDSEEEEVLPKKSRLSKDLQSSSKSSKKQIQQGKSVCKNSSQNNNGISTPLKKGTKNEISNIKKRTSTPKTQKSTDANDDISGEDDDVDPDYENESHSDSESEDDIMEENDKIISKNLMINENMFKEEFDLACRSDGPFFQNEMEFLKCQDNEQDDCEDLFEILEEKTPELIKLVDKNLKQMNKLHLSILNNNSHVYSTSLLQVFAYCVKTFKYEYNYEYFFENEKFDQLIASYFKYVSYERKSQGMAKAGVSSDGKTVVTKELKIKTIKRKFDLLFNWLRMFQCKTSKETMELFKSLPFRDDDIKARRGYEDTEELKWPLTLFDLNWYLEHHPIKDDKSLMAAALIAFVSYSGVRPKTLSKMLLKDMMIYQTGRKVSHITFTLTWLKECNDTKKVFLPGNLKPLDAAGLLIMYLDTRKVFEAGLDQTETSFVIKSDRQNEPLFLISDNDSYYEISNIYKELAKRLNAPKFAISPRSSRKGHCIQHLLNTKTIYPAMPLELLEEDLISGGTWGGKRNMRHYLKGGCDQVFETCNRIENIEIPPPSFDAYECHLFLVDALQIINDWKIAENDPSVEEMEKQMLKYGAKQVIKRKSLKEYSQELVSSINFYKKVKALKFEVDNLPKIAINVLPKVVNLEHGYCEGGEVFSKNRPVCETCKSVCIREKPVIKNFNEFSFKADKTFYLEQKGMDDNEFETKMAEQFTDDANQHKCLLKMFQDWSIEK